MTKRTIWLISIAAALVVLVGAGFGGYAWHERPSFCSTMCHKVMAPYVASYQNGPYLDNIHAKAGVTCLMCHKPTVRQQLGEVQKYVTGDYRTPLLFARIGTTDFCLECHGSYKELAKKTKGYDSGKGRNPHASHNGELDCFSCHRVHQQSQLFCSQCHPDRKVPSGWIKAGAK